MDYRELLDSAETVRQSAYAPYSHFAVGAALLCADGTVYTGSNIENASFTPTVCAERVAVFKAVSEGKRDFSAIAVAAGKEGLPPDTLIAPCGVCRQVLMEFCSSKNFDIVLLGAAGEPAVYKLGEILPMGFGPDNL